MNKPTYHVTKELKTNGEKAKEKAKKEGVLNKPIKMLKKGVDARMDFKNGLSFHITWLRLAQWRVLEHGTVNIPQKPMRGTKLNQALHPPLSQTHVICWRTF